MSISCLCLLVEAPSLPLPRSGLVAVPAKQHDAAWTAQTTTTSNSNARTHTRVFSERKLRRGRRRGKLRTPEQDNKATPFPLHLTPLPFNSDADALMSVNPRVQQCKRASCPLKAPATPEHEMKGAAERVCPRPVSVLSPETLMSSSAVSPRVGAGG